MDGGVTWTACFTNGTGLVGTFSQLVVKDATTMFMLRTGAVPLRTTDGGATWHELAATAPLFQYGATMSGSLSWSGQTLVISGVDRQHWPVPFVFCYSYACRERGEDA